MSLTTDGLRDSSYMAVLETATQFLALNPVQARKPILHLPQIPNLPLTTP